MDTVSLRNTSVKTLHKGDGDDDDDDNNNNNNARNVKLPDNANLLFDYKCVWC